MDSSFGQRLRDQRESYGFSPAELAQISGLAAGRIGELEQGGAPSVYEVEVLARALATDARILLDPSIPPDPKRSVARFRSPLGVTSIASADIRLLAQAAEVARIGAYLSAELGRSESPVGTLRNVVPVRGNRPPWSQGYELGERARERLVSGGKPIDSVQATFESLGIHVAFVDFDSLEIDAASLFETSAVPVILLNRRSGRAARELSRRAILAHELCHLLHDGGERDLLAAISRENDHTDIEKRANGFAPSFLAPKRYVATEGADPKSKVVQLAYVWGFTFEGAVWHAKNIGLIGEDDAKRLLNERRFGATVQPPFEPKVPRASVDELADPASVSSLVYGFVSDLTIAAAADGIISRGRALEILTIQ